MPLTVSLPMKAALVGLAAGGCLLLLAGWSFAQLSRNVPNASATTAIQSDRVNLALRRTADQLLRAAGDSTSRISAVQQPNSQTFQITLGHAFNYNQLPGLLHQSLQLHKVTGTYAVAVLDCLTRAVQLGYSASDLNGRKPVPCSGRAVSAGCFILQLTLDTPAPVEKPSPQWPFLAAGGLLIGALSIAWRRVGQVRFPADLPVVESRNQLRFGQSCLDMDNQLLRAHAQQHKLTYREAKLLRLLVSHANQVLERDQILKQVWEDEGVTVGRSLDVFVSRLRKLLTGDPTVKIAAVHGVGYKLEVQEPTA